MSFIGSSQLWTLGLRSHPEGSFSGKYHLRTENVVRIRDNGLEQLVVGGPGQDFKCCSHHASALQSSSPEVKPHHAGEAYSNEATVVVLATRCSCDGWRPRDLSFLSP